MVETHQGALKCDQTQKHPITSSVNTPEEIDNIFDHISYSKAASVIRMLTHLITENMFKLSLHKYLISNRFDIFIILKIYLKQFKVHSDIIIKHINI